MSVAHTNLDKTSVEPNGMDAPRRKYLKGLRRPRFENVREVTQSFQERVDFLSRQATALAREIADLKWSGLGVKPVSVEEGLDFYQEIRRFEISLIVQALRITHGSQKKAAALLKMNHTTLNTKVKGYKIEW